MFLFAIYFLNNFFQLDEAIYKVIFIGLASLTFPHILLEYLLEKNEKELKIYLASPRGFCAGVKRAIEIVEKAISSLVPLYTFGMKLYTTNKL